MRKRGGKLRTPTTAPLPTRRHSGCTLPLKHGPHGPIALGRPDAGRVDALGLVVGARDIEGLAVLEDRPAPVLRAHRRRGLVEAILQRGTARHASLYRLVEI